MENDRKRHYGTQSLTVIRKIYKIFWTPSQPILWFVVDEHRHDQFSHNQWHQEIFPTSPLFCKKFHH
jgi:hypothetical protein